MKTASKVMLLVAFLVALLSSPAAWGETVKQIGPDRRTHDVPVYVSDAAVPRDPHGYGIQEGTHFYAAAAFQPMTNLSSWDYGQPTDFYRFRTGGTDTFLYADFNVPSGGRVDVARLYYYDNDQAAAPTLWICRAWVDDSVGTNPDSDCPYQVTGDAAGTPGYTSLAITTSFTVLRYVGGPGDYTWYVVVSLPTTNSNIAFLGVRTIWNRQITPAPASATFTDVPTDYWAFRHIEALAASGITAGCGTGVFCPEQYVKRSEMAVYLAKALGLHYPW